MWQHWHQAGCLVPGAWDRARSGCVCPLTAVSPCPSCTNQECRPCPLPPFTPQPTVSAFCFHTAPSYPATPSFPAQLSFSGLWIVLTDSIYSSPSVACIPSHPSVVIVLTKATRTSWVHLVATSVLTSPRLHAGAQAPDHASMAGWTSASPLPLWLLHLTTFTGFSSSIGPLMFLFLRALSGLLFFADHSLSRPRHLSPLHCPSEQPQSPALQLHPWPFPGALRDGISYASEAPLTPHVQSDTGVCSQAFPCHSVP